MKKIYPFLILLLYSVVALGQNRPGFFYDYQPDFQITAGSESFEFPGSKVGVLNRLTDYSVPGKIHEDDISSLTILDSALTNVDTSIYFFDDTGSAYIYAPSHASIVNDTAYLLFDCIAKPSSGLGKAYPINLLFVKMDSALNVIDASYLFEGDSVGVLVSSGRASFKYNEEAGLFDHFLMQYDTINQHVDIVLVRLDRQGEIRYFKKWNYSVWTPNQASFTDFQDVGNGRYLLTQDLLTDMYVIADTAENEIDTSYFIPDLVTGLYSICKKGDSYILFGTADGDPDFNRGNKLQYIFMELDQQSLQEQSRHTYKLPDTVEYRSEALIWNDPFLILGNGDYLITAYESYGERNTNNLLSFCSIYRFDSTANLIWKFSIADTTHGESFGLPSMSKLSGGKEMILWHNAGYSTSPTGTPRQTWVMKFDPDGGNFDFSMDGERKQPKFSLYPNPVSDICVVLLPFVPTEEVSVEIYNMAGSLVKQNNFDQRDNRLEIKTTLPEGNYLIKVKTDAYEAAQKMMVKN